MPKPYGINGTPWHVERFHNNNPDDGRRHRSRCVFYDPKTKYCSMQMGECYGASHCKYYKEGQRDLITTDTATFETVQYKRPAMTFVPDKADDGTPENQIRVGDMIQIHSSRYMIVDAEMDKNRHHIYSCVLAREYENRQVAQKSIHIYSNWYLTDMKPIKCHAYEFGIVQHLLPAVVDHVKSERAMQEARKKADIQKRKIAEISGAKVGDYAFSSYAGKFKQPLGIKLEQMFLIVKTRGKSKKLSVKVDKLNQVIYIQEDLYKLHQEKIRELKSIDLSV